MSADHLTPGRRLLVTLSIGLAMFLAALDQTVVGTAMPRIVAELRGLDVYAWVLTAYLVTSTTLTPISGKLGDLFGRKPLLLVGMVGFVAASALCGLSQDMAQLIAFRAVQGVFGGILFSTVFASIADLYSPAERGKVQGMFAGIFGIASVLGPVIGGFLTDNVSWRWVFYVNVPVGLAVIPFVAFVMPAAAAHTRTWRDIDVRGAVLLAVGLVPLLVALSITRDHAWTSPEVVGLLAFGVVALAAFVHQETRAKEPIVPLGLFRNRTFAVACLTGFLVTVGMFGTIVFVPLVYQGVLGIAATNSGLLLTPMTFALVLGALTSGQLSVRVTRYRYVGTAGIALMSIGMLLLSGVTVGTGEAEVVRDLVLTGFGLGLTMPLYVNAAQSAVAREFTGVVTSQVQFWRNMGGTVGVAVLGAVLSERLPQRISENVAALGLPAEARAALPSGASAQALFDPAAIAAARAALPPQLAGVFDQVMGAVRAALASTLHDVFLIGAAVVATALVASVMLDDVPLRRPAPGTRPAPAFGD
ncbi:MAG TPA: MDR family MFS transporter [Candidatus Limnocylindria bacterium]|nr:MDR family MFS transporter [Candidatus Limnocylindria bacterium]